MTSYRMRISPKSRRVARFVSRVHREIQDVFHASGMTQQQLAIKLDVDRSTINKRLTGEANLTLRSIGELAWAMDREPMFTLSRPDSVPHRNYYSTASSSGSTEDWVPHGPRIQSSSRSDVFTPELFEESV